MYITTFLQTNIGKEEIKNRKSLSLYISSAKFWTKIFLRVKESKTLFVLVATQF